jgi:hypothetical protein
MSARKPPRLDRVIANRESLTHRVTVTPPDVIASQGRIT